MADIQLKIKALDNSEIQLSNKDIKSIESTAQSTGQPDTIYYGTVPSTGSVDINDRKGEFYNRIRNGELGNSNLPIELFANGKKVQSHIATDSDYDINGKVFSVDFENQLSEYDNVIYSGLPYLGEEKSLYDIFVDFATAVGFSNVQIENMLSSTIKYSLDNVTNIGTVQEYFAKIIIPHPHIEQGTVRETFDKFCTLAQLNLISNDNGDLIFVQARPVRDGNERVIVIPAKNQMSAVDRNIIVKNKILNANVIYKKVTQTRDEESAVTTIISKDPTNFWLNPDVVHGGIKYIVGNDITNMLGMCIQLSVFDTGYHKGKVVILKDETTKNVIEVSDDIRWRVTGTKKYGNARAPMRFSNTGGNWLEPIAVQPAFITLYGQTISDTDENSNYKYITNFSADYQASKIQPLDVSYSYTQYYESIYEEEKTLEHSISVNISPFIAMVETVGSYIFEYQIPIQMTTVKMSANYRNNSGFQQEMYGIFNANQLESGNWAGYEQVIAERLEVSIYGTTVSISLEDTNLVDIAEGETMPVTISGNEMLQEFSTVGNSNSLAQVIANNIVSDYKNGVSTCRVTVTCGDYADEYGVVRKHWEKGEIFQVGDIVRLDKDNNGTPAMTYKNGKTMLWKVTGRTFRHAGVPLIDLELQEIF